MISEYEIRTLHLSEKMEMAVRLLPEPSALSGAPCPEDSIRMIRSAVWSVRSFLDFFESRRWKLSFSKNFTDKTAHVGAAKLMRNGDTLISNYQ